MDVVFYRKNYDYYYYYFCLLFSTFLLFPLRCFSFIFVSHSSIIRVQNKLRVYISYNLFYMIVFFFLFCFYLFVKYFQDNFLWFHEYFVACPCCCLSLMLLPNFSVVAVADVFIAGCSLSLLSQTQKVLKCFYSGTRAILPTAYTQVLLHSEWVFMLWNYFNDLFSKL